MGFIFIVILFLSVCVVTIVLAFENDLAQFTKSQTMSINDVMEKSQTGDMIFEMYRPTQSISQNVCQYTKELIFYFFKRTAVSHVGLIVNVNGEQYLYHTTQKHNTKLERLTHYLQRQRQNCVFAKRRTRLYHQIPSTNLEPFSYECNNFMRMIIASGLQKIRKGTNKLCYESVAFALRNNDESFTYTSMRGFIDNAFSKMDMYRIDL